MIELGKEADIFIPLGQMDQRLNPGEVYPYPKLKPTMISVWELGPDECHLETFDKSRKPWMTTIKQFREQSLRLHLQKGRYMIVPSTKNQYEGSYTPFFLSIYFECGKEADQGGDIFEYFQARYVNAYTGEDQDHIHGYVIQEEDEDEKRYIP